MKYIIFLVLTVVIVLAVFQNRKTDSDTSNSAGSIGLNTASSPTPLPVDTADWKEYKSPRFYYKFSYPPNWSAAFFDEANKDVIMGSHSLGNYDYVKINEFMDHGQVDWPRFMGDNVALKFDLRAEKLNERTKEMFIEEYYKDSQLQNTSKLKFGEFVTFQYNSISPVTDYPVHTFVTYIPNETVLVADVYVFYKPENVDLESTEEWNELRTLFGTFRYEE